MAPKPPTFGAPRRSRGAPLGRALGEMGPRHGPQAPNVRSAPAQPWRSSGPGTGRDGGPRHGALKAPTPHVRSAPAVPGRSCGSVVLLRALEGLDAVAGARVGGEEAAAAGAFRLRQPRQRVDHDLLRGARPLEELGAVGIGLVLLALGVLVDDELA